VPPTQVAPKLLSWASDLDPNAARQAERTARLPFVDGHVALMPDAHVGIGATVGSVIPTRDAIIPAAVGVDIGCGMVAVETDLVASDLPDDLSALMPLVARRIPAGVGQGHEHAVASGRYTELGTPATELSDKQAVTAARQFGTLGSGNHFVEVCLDEREHVWTVLHSGSRGIGNQLAQKHITRAKGEMKRLGETLEDPDLAYFVQGTPEFEQYVTDMLWAQRYAMASRAVMSERVVRSLVEVVGKGRALRTINCFAGETEVITAAGTAPIADLAGGMHELLTTDGRWVKAPVRSFGRQRLWRIRVSRNGVEKSIYATAEHRWFLRTHSSGGTRYWGRPPAEALTRDLKPGQRLAYCFPQRPEGRSVDPRGAARGFVFGDGTKTGTSSVALFCGAKDHTMRSLFTGLGNPPRTYGTITKITGLPREWKAEFPPLDAPPPYLYGWLAGYFAADGDVDRSGRPTLACASRETLAHVRTICDLVGVGTYGIRRRDRVGFGDSPTPIYLMGLMRGDLDAEFFFVPEHRARFEANRQAVERRGWIVLAVEETDRVEEVFCAMVDGTHAFALADHILTSNCHHNFTQRETHDGREVWVTRKGAIKAAAGDEGVIPGSMGTRSYIVRGLGNTASYNSCSHGAGRRLSRGQAKKNLTVESLREAMAGKAWLERDAKALLDEHPAAYKDIDQVMADQRDLVEVQHTLSQVFNYKGL
jgi:RNA-splicing ligase RtcB